MTYDIAALKRKVLTIYPFFGSVASKAGYQEAEATSSIKSDGSTIFYDPKYMAGLSANDQVFMLARELCHIAFRHGERGEGKDPEIWKTATEAVVNQMLKRDGLDMARGAVDYPEAIDYDAEQYYEFLLAEKLDIELIDGQLKGSENPAGGVKGDDEPPGQEDGSDDDGDDTESDDAGDEAQQELLPDEEGAEEDRDDSEDEDEDEKEEYALVEEKESQAGNAVNRDTRPVEDIGKFPPVIDWRLLLRDTVNYGVDWSYKNAVLDDGIVRPVLEEIPVPETEIVLDTSWSVNDDLLRSFLRECKNILPLSRLKAGCFDTVFYGFHDIRTEKDIDDMIFEGGGGTDFNVAADAFTLRVDNRIIFTDGQAPMPDSYLKAIWVVYGDEDIDPPGGTVIRIDPEQLGCTRP